MTTNLDSLREEFYNHFPTFADKCGVTNKEVADFWLHIVSQASQEGYERGVRDERERIRKELGLLGDEIEKSLTSSTTTKETLE